MRKCLYLFYELEQWFSKKKNALVIHPSSVTVGHTDPAVNFSESEEDLFCFSSVYPLIHTQTIYENFRWSNHTAFNQSLVPLSSTSAPVNIPHSH